MGLDGNIYKRPPNSDTEVKYWRKNWVLQYWMDTNNGTDKYIDVYTMEQLLNDLPNMQKEGYMGAEQWEDDDWDAFADEIREVIKDMKANETYEYTYNGDW